jgi:hypothetical protein
MSGFAILEGRRGRVCMEVGFATTYAVSASSERTIWLLYKID